MLGRIATRMQIVTYSTPVLGSMLAGVLANCLDPRIALLIMLGIDVLAGALLLTPRFTKRRDLPRRESFPAHGVTT